MIRLVQKKLIIPRGDTGAFTVPLIKAPAASNAAIFTIMNPMTHKKICEKIMTNVNGNVLVVEFSHLDTVNLPVGKYVWDIKFYQDPEFDEEGHISNGIEVDSYYAAYSLPVCEIRQTGDRILTDDSVPAAALSLETLNLIDALLKQLRKGIAKTEENVSHYPTIINNEWHIWDANQGKYVGTGVAALPDLSIYAPKANPVFQQTVTLGSRGESEDPYGTNSITAGTENIANGQDTQAFGTQTIAEGRNAYAEGYMTEAHYEYTVNNNVYEGRAPHAEGHTSKAYGTAHAEGMHTRAQSDGAHAEGYYTSATGAGSHAEGYETIAASNAHAEGHGTLASDIGAHAEGLGTTASGYASHAEGSYQTVASGNSAHAEGYHTTASGEHSHAEGDNTTASALGAHVEGRSTQAAGVVAHAEGQGTIASTYASHAEGLSSKATGNQAHAENYGTTAAGAQSHAEGYGSIAGGVASHAENYYTTAAGDYSHAEGDHTAARSTAQHVGGSYNIPDADDTYIEIIGNGDAYADSNARTLDWNGNEVLAGKLTVSVGPINAMDVATKRYVDNSVSGYAPIDAPNFTSSISLGRKANTTVGNNSIAVGFDVTASRDGSQAFGNGTSATGQYAYAEGQLTTASAPSSHAEGQGTTAAGHYSHAEGNGAVTEVSAQGAHAEGEKTIASANNQHVVGRYNQSMGSNYVEIVGNGYKDNQDVEHRSNARTLDWDGNEVLAGKLTLGAGPTANMDAATKQYVDAAIPDVPAWALASTKPTYTAAEVGALPESTTIPTRISDLLDDSNHYIKPSGGIPDTDLAERYVKVSDLNEAIENMVCTQYLLAKNRSIGTYWNIADNEVVVYNSNDYGRFPAITGLKKGTYSYKSLVRGYTIIEYENGTLAKLNTFEGADSNASGTVTIPYDFTLYPSIQTAATYSVWTEGTSIPEDGTEGLWRQNSGIINYVENELNSVKLTVPTKTSDLINDSGYLTSFTETDPTVPAWAKASNKPVYTAAEVGATTASEVSNMIASAIGEGGSFDIEIVQALPTENIKEHTFYFVAKTGSTNDVYDEYIYLNNAWEKIGNTQIDLSNYALKSELPVVPTNVSSFANDSGYLTSHQDISGKADTTDLAAIAFSGDYEDLINTPTIPTSTITDVQVNGTSVLNNGIANVPTATATRLGVVSAGNGLYISSGQLSVNFGTTANVVKQGTHTTAVTSISRQHEAAFYGLAKAAGDSTQVESDNAVGTYTATAKAAIQHMLGISNLIATEENNLVASKAYAIGDIFTANGKLYQATAAIAENAAIIPSVAGEEISGANCIEKNIGEIFPHDIQINGTSILSNKIANIPLASTDNAGVIRVNSNYGLVANSSTGLVSIRPATTAIIKDPASSTVPSNTNPIVPATQHTSVFYGLAKAAGDTTQAASDNAVGTYTATAKTAIKTMLGVTDPLISDVQINSTSIVSNGTANIPVMTHEILGVAKVSTADYGIGINANQQLQTLCPSVEEIKQATQEYKPIVPKRQHAAVFYGLAKAAGDTTQALSHESVGTYTSQAQYAIQQMLGINLVDYEHVHTITNISDADPTITATSGTQYICDEVGTLSFTPSSSGLCDVIFTSGSTPTILTIPNTVKFPAWFDATNLSANTIYEINVLDGEYGVVAAWPA